MRLSPVMFTSVLLAALSPLSQARPLSEIQASGVLKVATSADFEPFNFMNGGKPAGFEIDLTEQVARRLGLRVQWVVRPFDGLLPPPGSAGAVGGAPLRRAAARPVRAPG